MKSDKCAKHITASSLFTAAAECQSKLQLNMVQSLYRILQSWAFRPTKAVSICVALSKQLAGMPALVLQNFLGVAKRGCASSSMHAQMYAAPLSEFA